MNKDKEKISKNVSTSLFRAKKNEDGAKLIAFIAGRLGISNKKSKAIINERNVFVNRRRTWMASHIVRFNDRVEIAQPAKSPDINKKTRILYRCSDYIIVDKPAGVLSQGKDSIEEKMRSRFTNIDLNAAHRIDRDTSGCLLLAMNTSALTRIVEVFRSREVKKIYHAICVGPMRGSKTNINMPLEGKTAVSRLRKISGNKSASHLEIRISTGRTHQIRKHLASIQLPVLGDRNYGSRRKATTESLAVPRHMLHASAIEFIDPATKKKISARSPLPDDFRKCLKLFHIS